MDFEGIKSEYVRLRTSGMDAKSALSHLRASIVGLEMRQREKLLEQLRLWEINRAAGVPASGLPRTPEPSAAPLIKPLPSAGATAISPPLAEPVPKSLPGEDAVVCPHCGKPNKRDDIFCTACGQLLTMDRGLFDTRHFVDSDDTVHSDEYFGPDSTLVLMVKGTQETFSIRPQSQAHEVIVGRGAGVTMRPDIDLSPHQAVQLGVSRLHLTIHYNDKQRTLSASDMDSANGSFINGQRLYPEEVRTLRHGDEVRLGKLTLVVYFHRSPPPDQIKN